MITLILIAIVVIEILVMEKLYAVVTDAFLDDKAVRFWSVVTAATGILCLVVLFLVTAFS